MRQSVFTVSGLGSPTGISICKRSDICIWASCHCLLSFISLWIKHVSRIPNLTSCRHNCLPLEISNKLKKNKESTIFQVLEISIILKFVNISLLFLLIEEKEKIIYEKKWIFQILNRNIHNHLVQLMSEILKIVIEIPILFTNLFRMNYRKLIGLKVRVIVRLKNQYFIYVSLTNAIKKPLPKIKCFLRKRQQFLNKGLLNWLKRPKSISKHSNLVNWLPKVKIVLPKNKTLLPTS
ncbi:hypothetical protein BpHYR1_028175 [Brachionus plicatilis]|uniref:Uncharacterized protein n=1 Tax=Brachionus plicatilis TaxID=10195 RepID=A0A3M7QGV0_BRAPC|nr:hypothetical protein BpHYR1_028175 [Brachionus plicatilis]